MLRLKRWIAATLAACLFINTIPVYAFAETDEWTSNMESTSEVIEPSSSEQSASEAEELTSEDTQIPQEIQETEIQETENNVSPQETENTIPPQETENTAHPQETERIDPSQKSQESMELLLTLEDNAEVSMSETEGENATQLAAEGEIPPVGDTFADNFIAKLNEKNISTTITKGTDNIITLTIGEGQGEILALLSQQTQTADSNYQNWNIKFDFTGELPLPDTFLGLGDWGESQEEQLPFKGKFTNQAITIKTSKTLFKALDASADLHGNSIKWEIGTNAATPTIPILTNVLVADGEEHTVNMPLASANRFNPYIGQLTGDIGQVTLPTLNYSGVGTSPAVNFTEHVGLICCSMDGGTNLQVGEVMLPSVSINLKSSQNAGSLVGDMGEGAKLTIADDMTLNATLNGVNAGGLVGSMRNATIDVAEGITVTVNASLSATEAAGGIAGVAATGTGPLAINSNVVLQSVKANGTQNSGVLYGTCTATGEFIPLTGVSFGENAVREVSGSGNCGGLFGTLTLQEDGKCILGSAEGELEITTSLTDAANNTCYGGVAGMLNGDRDNALVVERCTIISNIDVGSETAKYPKYLGGIVAKQNATLDVKSSTVTVSSPKTITAADRGFGGVTAYLKDGALLIADEMKVTTDSYLTNPGGGSVVGSAHRGSIVYLKTSLDLSKCELSTNATSGQIVGSQDCSLIYAPDVAIFRLDKGKYRGMELDDIGNYGELYRINSEDPDGSSKKPFLSVGEDYNVTFNYSLTISDTGYTLSTKEDYACLALAWQSRGYFPTVSGVTSENWSILQSNTITLGADIDLTGCGIGGLTRDVDSDSENDKFSGILNGNNHTIILDIGGKNQVNTPEVPRGDGRIYWHNATGLFAVLSSKATVKNLTLDGTFRLSNNKLSTMYSGALAAQMKENRDGDSTFSQLTTKVRFDANVNGANTLYLGGLIGLIASGYAYINLDVGTTLASTITISHSGNGSTNHFGGAIGGIANEASVAITCNGATICGAILFRGTVNNLYAGGLIGTIWPMKSSAVREIKLTNLTVNDFTLSGNATERMGGILGGIWADTDVKVNGLTVSNSTLTANGKAALGGLVYRASGKWTVSSVDLSGLTISASNASALGLLVCHGEPYKDAINGSDQDMKGLYLEMTEHWAAGYQVPNVSDFSNDIFDEFVAYTAYRYNDGSSDITHNGSGIISLKTGNGTVNMTSGERNTYVNRTAVGQSKQTNCYSRYYYNLPQVKEACNGEKIDTANEFLIWSVYRYAASNLISYFQIDNVNKSVIGGTSDSPANFDMKGLSYYPISITNSNVTVEYANVTFYNNEIETKEADNKSTREISKKHTQHYTMHCAMFLNFTAENEDEEYKMTVNGVTFAGTVGMVNSGSGALLCGTVEGENRQGNTATCTVILADADESRKTVSLKGLSVVSEGDYAPVLINKIGSYAGLTANYVTTTNYQTGIAGSSLIGNVGGVDATNVTITFGGTIKLSEQKSGEEQVFTKATLLNSLQYVDGSATYTFDVEKDINKHDATHGKELTTSVEYEGKIGFYDDQETTPIASKTGASDFSGYLPYIAFSPATKDEEHTLDKNWHELAVNIHSYNLINGCGTYGHPYIVTAREFREAASFVNSGKASNGWKVNMPIDNAAYHSTDDDNDTVLFYKKDNAESIRKHLRSAYYKLVNDENGKFELSNFNGIGSSPDIAFMGVIYSDGITITLTGGSSAFIKYSYGSVVRDVSFVLQQTPSLTRKDPFARTARRRLNRHRVPSLVASSAAYWVAIISSKMLLSVAEQSSA